MVEELCGLHGIAKSTYQKWKAKYGGMSVSDAVRLKALEQENNRLKRLVADLSLETIALKGCINKKVVKPAGNKITIKSVNFYEARLPSVIYGAIGNPSPEKVLQVIESYKNPDYAIIGAFIGDIFVGTLGIHKTSQVLTILHISVLENYQRQGIGTLLLEQIKKQYQGCKIAAETDTESVNFYAKSGFICHAFNGSYDNLRYKCEFNL